MTIEEIIFYCFATLLVLSALAVILVRNPVHSVLFLILSFFFSAGIWLLLEAEFLAIVLVLVYVGAVMVLFLFIVMMLDINLTKLRSGFIQYLPVGLIIAISMIAIMSLVINQYEFIDVHPVTYTDDSDNTRLLGITLFTDYLYPFEIAGAILLLAIIAAIGLTFRGRKNSKAQDPAQQVTVKKEDRIKLVNLKSEKPGT